MFKHKIPIIGRYKSKSQNNNHQHPLHKNVFVVYKLNGSGTDTIGGEGSLPRFHSMSKGKFMFMVSGGRDKFFNHRMMRSTFSPKCTLRPKKNGLIRVT